MPGMPPVKRRMYPTKQIAVAEMWVKLEQTTRSVSMRRTRAWIRTKEQALRAYAAQYTIMEDANELCDAGDPHLRRPGHAESLPLERLYRDSAAAR